MIRMLSWLLLLASGSQPVAAATVIGPVPYRQRSDSPFFRGIEEGTIYLEDFEDGALNTPGVSGRYSGIYHEAGVDEDDGAVDGRGNNYALHGSGIIYVDESDASEWFLELSFTPDPRHGHPTYVGLALLGFTVYPPQFESYFLFRAYDSAGAILAPGNIRVDRVRLPANTPSLSTAGDQFIGIYSDTGISRILVSAGKIDHLQYGWAIPEPGTVTLGGLAAALLLARRRRVTAYGL